MRNKVIDWEPERLFKFQMQMGDIEVMEKKIDDS